MENKNEIDEVTLELDPDESQHLKSIPEKYINILRIANYGAVMAGEISAEACKGLLITNEKMILSMLVLKIVEQIRTSIRGILLGHYSAVPVLLRSSLDSISVLRLTSNNRRQFKIWILLSYIDRGLIKTDDNSVKKLRREFNSKARKSYDDLISNDPHLRPVSDLIIEFNAHVHPDIYGVYERAGVQADVEDILGDSIQQAVSISKGNLIEAIKLLDIKDKYHFGYKAAAPSDTETITFGPGIVEDKLLDHYSQVAHAAAHHFFDIVEDLFNNLISDSTRKEGEEWHELSMGEFEALKSSDDPKH